MKLTEYAKLVGVTRGTSYRWFRDGQIEGAYQKPSGLIIIPDSILEPKATKSEKTFVYARVSNASRRTTDLEAHAVHARLKRSLRS